MMIKYKLIILLIAFFLMTPSFSHAGYKVEWTPAISIDETYDDNINLESVNEQEDWITTISPSIALSLVSEKTNMTLRYAPAKVMYKDQEEYNYLRHSGALTFNKSITSRLSFDFTDSLTRSEDPVEETAGIYQLRRTRNIYLRNSASAGIQYLLGPENSLDLGYDYSFLRNDDATLLDNDSYSPSAGLTYWLSINNGIELTYKGTLINYSREGQEVARESVSGDAGGIRYVRRVSTHTTASMGYTYTSRYIGDIKGYDVHEGDFGLDQSFSSDVSLSLSVGYYLLKDEVSGDDNGYSYNISLNRSFNRGSISIGGSGGWREGYLEADRTGFTKYYGVSSDFNCQVLENLSNYAGISYRQDEDPTESITKDYRANYGWTLSFLRWFSVSLDYSYLKRDDDLDVEDYNDNRVTMTLTASRLFR